MRTRSAFILLSLSLLSLPSAAGVVPLKLLGRRAKPDLNSRIVASVDTVEYTLLADRIEAAQMLVLESGSSSVTATLGVPLPKSKWEGCQDLKVSISTSKHTWDPKPRLYRALGSEDLGVARWLGFPLKLAAGEKLQVSLTWWQPYSQIDLYGYARLGFEDPLWTAGSFKGFIPKIVRRVRLTQGIHWSQSSPTAEEVPGPGDEHTGESIRQLSYENSSPKPGSTFKVILKRTMGALSPCEGSDPWYAVDGDPKTSYVPTVCSTGQSFVDLVSDCKGFGTSSPDCNEAGVQTWDLGASLRTSDSGTHGRYMLEAYWGRKRLWKKPGRQNKPLSIHRIQHLTRYRVIFADGFPKGGPGELSLVRLDPKLSTDGFRQILSSKGWRRMGSRCLLRFELRNPASLRHAVLVLKPHSKTDAFMLSMDCTDGRNREPFHEPIEHHHTAAQYRAMGIDPNAANHEHHHHFKRKRPWRIELPLDPKCVAYRFRLQAPPMLCSKRFHAVIPHILLEY